MGDDDYDLSGLSSCDDENVSPTDLTKIFFLEQAQQNKENARRVLEEMGFVAGDIERGIEHYERTFPEQHEFKVEVITEMIQNIQQPQPPKSNDNPPVQSEQKMQEKADRDELT